MITKPLPRDDEAERALLGCVLLAPDACLDEVIPILGDAAAFGATSHAAIWAAVLALHTDGVPVDSVTVGDRLAADGTLDTAGGRLYLVDLTMPPPLPRHALRYAQIIRDHAVRRRIISASCETMAAAWDQERTVDEALAQMDRAADDITTGRAGPGVRSAAELIPALVEHLEGVANGDESDRGLATGWASLDKLARLSDCEMYVIAARPSVGKTAMACNIACDVALRQGAPVGIMSLEMDAVRLLARMESSLSGVSERALRTGALSAGCWQDIMDQVAALRAAPIWIDDTPDLTVFDIRAAARRLAREHGIRLLIVDYLQYVRVDEKRFGSRQEAVADVSRNLKALAKQLQIPVLVLAQLNREAEGVPRIAHLRESGAIEQDADVIVLLHDKGGPCDAQTAPVDAIVAKNRNGATGIAHLHFRPACVRFEEPARPGEEDERW